MTTTAQASSLNPLSFPLYGSRLIEASAGTGKTFTLALLYTRLVLGQDVHGQGYQRPLTPREILVVTFTELAAGELRDRIRARLVAAAEYFCEPQLAEDSLLVQLRDNYAPEHWPSCAWRLQMASESMDEASISTIHSWCNRMLVEHAFDTRGLFNRELVTDTSELLTQVVQDYWRVHFYALDSAEANLVSRLFATPAALQYSLRDLLQPSISGLSFKGTIISADFAQVSQCLQQMVKQQQQQQQALEQARQHWSQHWQQIHDHLQDIRPDLNGTTHGSAKADKFDELLGQIGAWAQQQGQAPDKLYSFASNSIKFKKGKEPEQAPPQAIATAFTLLQQYNELAAEQSDELLPLLLSHAAVWVRQEFERRMQRQAQMGFNDLLLQLERALDPELAGEHASQLAATLKNGMPVALIDEFQDTDPIQYRIFDRIYQVAANDKGSGLFLIGDPKQSIYSFRGADIQTYLQARRDTNGRHYTLDKNFRSTSAVVAACNAFFAHAEQQPQGAFGYQDEQGNNQIPFVRVDAQGKEQQLWQHGQPVAPMTLWYFDAEDASGLSSSDYRNQAAQVAASQIVQWLNAGAVQHMGFGRTEVETALQPADIAILVRNATEAKSIARALHERNLPSVYLSDRESLFASQEAADVLHWLRACAAPEDERLLRAALGTLTLALPLQQLLDWHNDELAWEQQTGHFYHWQRIWQRQGVLVMLQRMLQHYQLPARLLQQPGGERSLTNLLHLAEWLQQTSTRLDSQQALIRQLSEQLGKQDEQALLRLESDAQRIKILTIHKSKGLEFKLVVLPFISSWRDIDGKQRQVPYQINGQRYSETAGNKEFAQAWQQANQERIREDLRLLYVALTRASYALWLGIAPLKNGNSKQPQLERSALGHILNGGQVFADAAAVQHSLAQLAAGYSGIRLQRAPAACATLATPPAPEQLEPAQKAPDLGYLRNWWIASYSALEFDNRAITQLIASEPDSAREEQHYEISQSESSTPLPTTASRTAAGDNLMHAFPRGAQWGTFLHGLLEWAAAANNGQQAGFAAAVADQQAREQMLQRRCQLRNIDELAQPLGDWLHDFLQQRWHSTGFALCDLQPQQLAVELEFLLEIHQVNTGELDALVRAHAGSDNLPGLHGNRLNGLLKGFIDLVAEHEGRYYIIDWKSNYLGDTDAAYSQQAMQQAIDGQRYDLQYLIYTLALHRQLRSRLPGYDYEQHMGGAVYCFLRGWRNSQTQGIFHTRPPRELIEQLDQLFSQGART